MNNNNTNLNEEILKIIEANPDMRAIQTYKKKDRIKDKGDTITQHWYVKNGLIKGFDVAEDTRKEGIINFLSMGNFLSLDVLRKEPLPVNLEVVEDAIIYTITEENFKILKARYPILNDIVEKNFHRMKEWLCEKAIFISYNNATERYNKMKEKYKFLDRLTEEDAAAFVGFSVKTISNIRLGKKTENKKISEPKKKNNKKKGK